MSERRGCIHVPLRRASFCMIFFSAPSNVATLKSVSDRTVRLTEDVLRERGFRRSPPEFHALVAESTSGLVGMAVFYIIPFTAEAVPALFIKNCSLLLVHSAGALVRSS